MYPMAVICLFEAWDSFCVAHRFWLPCHISTKLWTLAILCNLFFSASLLISESFSVFIVSNDGSLMAKIPLLARANSLTMTFLPGVSPMVFDGLQPITLRATDILASTLTPCGVIEKMSRATYDRLAYSECVSSCCCQQLVISGIQYVLLISTDLEWYSLRFGLICPQRVLATVPYFEPAGCIGLSGNSLTTSPIDYLLSELPN